VDLEFVEADELPRNAGREALNRWLEDFYNADAPPATRVPYTFWRGGCGICRAALYGGGRGHVRNSGCDAADGYGISARPDRRGGGAG